MKMHNPRSVITQRVAYRRKTGRKERKEKKRYITLTYNTHKYISGPKMQDGEDGISDKRGSRRDVHFKSIVDING